MRPFRIVLEDVVWRIAPKQEREDHQPPDDDDEFMIEVSVEPGAPVVVISFWSAQIDPRARPAACRIAACHASCCRAEASRSNVAMTAVGADGHCFDAFGGYYSCLEDGIVGRTFEAFLWPSAHGADMSDEDLPEAAPNFRIVVRREDDPISSGVRPRCMVPAPEFAESTIVTQPRELRFIRWRVRSPDHK